MALHLDNVREKVLMLWQMPRKWEFVRACPLPDRRARIAKSISRRTEIMWLYSEAINRKLFKYHNTFSTLLKTCGCSSVMLQLFSATDQIQICTWLVAASHRQVGRAHMLTTQYKDTWMYTQTQTFNLQCTYYHINWKKRKWSGKRWKGLSGWQWEKKMEKEAEGE